MGTAAPRNFDCLRMFFVLCLLLSGMMNAKAASANCASKFVGNWLHYNAGVLTNTAVLTEDGISVCGGNPGCVKNATWTCNGNVLTYNNGFYLTEYTLQPNGTMTAHGGTIVVVRVGSGSNQNNQVSDARCSTPPPGRTYVDQNQQCIRASNTNSGSKCKYSFTYLSSILGRMSGGVVEPGHTDTSICGRPGETVRFEKWTLVPVSAQ